MMQMLTLWYLQERGFFNGDKSYFITKFKEMAQKKLVGGFNSYYDFLNYFFEKISDYSNRQYYMDNIVGRVVVVGPAVFINGEHSSAISIPDKCFYKEGMTEILINTPPKRVSDDVPLLNLFESRDWTEGNIDEFVLGSIYEKLITYMERKKLGAYYTPEEITSYICKNTIEPYLVDRINEIPGNSFESIDEIIESGNKKTLLNLFDLLKDIKILDPAVGSAHFLESAINVLIDIYEKVWEKAKELGINKLDIVASDEKGRIKKINLLHIPKDDRDRFRLYVKFFIILSRNIYGVDINPSALKVARARLFLTLAKHFRVGKENDIFIRFPNVHFNLRPGNSLIGYVELEREKESKQTVIELFAKEDKAPYRLELIKKHFKPIEGYLVQAARELEIKSDIAKEVEELDDILSKDKITWRDFEKVLRTKEKLIKILIASLNSSYAKPLNELLNRITELFNNRLDEKFAEEHGIDLEELKQIKTFHWIFEFPEVFLRENPGFDVVIGNPPYVRQEDINHIVEGVEYKDFLSKLYEPFDNTFDYSMFFMLRSLQITRNFGYHSFIITNKWLRSKYGKKIRKYLKENFVIKKLIDFNGIKVFVGATVDTMIYNITKKKTSKQIRIFYNNPKSLDKIELGGFYQLQSSLSEDIWNFVNQEIEEIKKWIEKAGKPLDDLGIKVYRGITTGFNEAFIIKTETRNKLVKEDPKNAELIKPLLRGRDINRYYIDWQNLWIIFTRRGIAIEKYPAILRHLEKFKERLMPKPKNLTGEWKGRKPGDYKWFEIQDNTAYYKEFEKPKIISTKATKKPSFVLDFTKSYILNTSYLLSTDDKTILAILNSNLTYFYLMNMGSKLSKMFEPKVSEIKKLPIPNTTQELKTIVNKIVDYLLFLNFNERIRSKVKDIIEFFDRQIADSLVYELYFKEKFHEDGLYAEPKEYLLEAVSKHLKPINYDRWAELHWKKQLEGELSDKEEKELQKLEKENMEIIEEVYQSLLSDEKIKELIERIKSHEWVRVIEGKG